MNLSYPREGAATILLGRGAVALLFSAGAIGNLCLVARSATAQSPSQALPHLPDMSSYDCAAVPQAAPADTRHIGQVINGSYNEWYESFVRADAQPRLACISLVRPTTRQLARDEAVTFLTSSFAVDAPIADTAERASSAEHAARPEAIEPANVQPEPLKRLRKPSPPADTNNTAEKSSGLPDLPPLPSGKDLADIGTGAAPGSERERARNLASSGSARDHETPATTSVEDREQVVNAQVYPWNAMAYLSATYPNGKSFRCSATLVSPYVALTAGHCVHNNGRGGYIASARVYPGQNQATLGDDIPIRPYGLKSDIASVQTTAQWAQMSGQDSYLITDYRHDLAALEFKTPFTHTATFMPVLFSSTSSPITSAGYPGKIQNKDAYGLYSDSGGETSTSFFSYRSLHVREFHVDASGGNSGGAFFYIDPGTNQRYLVGSLSYAEDLDDQGGGPWYDSWNQTLVSGWVSWTPGSSAAAASVAGLRVASIFGSAQAAMVSYLRFYNAGASQGTVDVVLADYATGTTLATWRSPNLPGGSSRQFSIEEIENNASATFTKSAAYSISVRPTFTGTFQNVLWQKTDGILTNLSTCDSQSSGQTTLTNVHSSLMDSGYPSTVVFHNTGAGNISPALGIYNAQSGQRLGTFPTGTIAANSQKVVAMPALEAAAGFSPNGVYHYNVRADAVFSGYLQHLMTNKAARVVSDMTAACRLTP
ncbi:MAG: trypsin-like serine protease [Rhodospirillaceae bacterium]|nr:trypsin-like serine protease [Rhodospirillaceae bacterium]